MRTLAIVAALALWTAAPASAEPYDYDNDGYADLTVSVTGEDLRGVKNGGAVQVLYGSKKGVSTRDQIWHQDRKGIKNSVEPWDQFGSSFASADFDDDGYADLAIGVAFENIKKIKNAGAVQVLYGGPDGLTARDQIWHQGKPGVPGANEAEDLFGIELAAGDFDADGYPDLAIGAPYEDIGTTRDAGNVVILRGSAAGLTSKAAESVHAGQPQESATFGRLLTSGDIDGDGTEDLVTRTDAPDQDGWWGSTLWVRSGDSTQLIAPADLGLPSYWHIGDMKIADLNDDGRGDLVVTSNVSGAIVAVLHGHDDGLHPAPLAANSPPGNDGLWLQSWWNDDTGPQVAAGEVTGDNYPDVVVQGTGDVDVINGTAAGLGSEITIWKVATHEWSDLAVLPFSGGTHAWLATDTGNDVAVQRGSPQAFSKWSQNTPGIKGVKERGDGFGGSIGGG